MFAHYLRFVRALSTNRVGRWGVVLTTSAFGTFILMQAAMLVGLVTNAYVGLIVYLLLPALFVLGLLLIPVGWRLLMWESGLSSRELLRQRLGEEEVGGGSPERRSSRRLPSSR